VRPIFGSVAVVYGSLVLRICLAIGYAFHE